MSAPKTLGAHHVSLTVTDLDRSIDYYTRVFGLEVRTRFERKALLHDGTQGLVLTLPHRPIDGTDRRFDEARVGLDHLGFRVAGPDEVRQAADHLKEIGVAFEGPKPGTPKDSLLVVFRDPDQIQLEFYYAP
jgi:glyoxylase I family protein